VRNKKTYISTSKRTLQGRRKKPENALPPKLKKKVSGRYKNLWYGLFEKLEKAPSCSARENRGKKGKDQTKRALQEGKENSPHL